MRKNPQSTGKVPVHECNLGLYSVLTDVSRSPLIKLMTKYLVINKRGIIVFVASFALMFIATLLSRI